MGSLYVRILWQPLLCEVQPKFQTPKDLKIPGSYMLCVQGWSEVKGKGGTTALPSFAN